MVDLLGGDKYELEEEEVRAIWDRRLGFASGSSGSSIPRPISVVSTPFAVPVRAPAPGMRSMGRGHDGE